jgi:hypothetical protein
VLVKYTYYGDTDLNVLIDFDDYVLIDLAFNTQSGTLGRALSLLDGTDKSGDDMSNPALRRVEQHLAEFGADYASHFLAAVPEPTALTLAFAVLPLARRRRRRK